MAQVLQLDKELTRELYRTDNQRLYYLLEEFIRKMNAKFSEIESTVANTLIAADGSGNLAEGSSAESTTYSIDSNAPTEKTIASGEITVTGNTRVRYHTIDTEGDAASDNLDTVNGGNVGDILILEAENSSRTVVCKNGASLRLGADFSLDHASDKLICFCTASGVWDQWGRSSGA